MDRMTLWDFAVSLYGRPGVSEACLALQEEGGVDVPVLLYGAWLGQRAIRLSQPDAAEIAGAVEAWREEVVAPLRLLRRRLKSGPAPAPSARTDALRNAVKDAELSAERIELDVLEALDRQSLPPSGGRPFDNMIAIVGHYRRAEAEGRMLSLVQAIAEALAAGSG